MSCDSDRAQYTRAQIRRNSDILKKLRENSDKGTTPTRSNTAPQKICKEGSDTGIKNKRTSPARRSQAGSSFDGAESKESVIRSRLSTRSISKLLLSGVLDGTSFRSSQSVPRGRVYSRESSRETPAIRSSYTTSLAGDADLQDGYDPPRPPRPGMEWVWFPEGYWAERELPPSSNYASASLLKWTRRNNNQSSSSHASVYSNTSEAADGRWRTRSSPTGPTGPLDRLAAPTGKSRRSPKNRDGRSSASPNSKSILGKLQYMSPTYPHFKSPDGSPEGLYCKTKRVLGSDSRRRAMSSELTQPPSVIQDKDKTPTTKETLDAASNYFTHFQRRKKTTRSSVSASPEERVTKPRRKIGLAPWHRNGSHDTVGGWTASSSIRNLLMGRTPVTTPQPRKDDPLGPDKNLQYFQIEVSPGSDHTPLQTPAPLGSRMMDRTSHGTPLVHSIQRVSTPPLASEMSTGKLRGFFFDLTPGGSSTSTKNDPFDAHHTHRPDSFDMQTGNSRPSSSKNGKSQTHPSLPTTPSSSNQSNRSNRQWWDGDEGAISSRVARTAVTRGSFVLDIPEHLPSSPLCPMHPKHKSGGKGICPFHGRRRVDEETASTRMKGTGGSVTGAAREGRMRVDDFRTLKSVPAEIPED